MTSAPLSCNRDCERTYRRFALPLIPSAQRHAIRHQPLARHFVSNVFNVCIPYASNALLLLLILPAVLLVSIHRL